MTNAKTAHLYIDYDTQPITSKNIDLYLKKRVEMEKDGVEIKKTIVYLTSQQCDQFPIFLDAELVLVEKDVGKNATDMKIGVDILKSIMGDVECDVYIIASSNPDFIDVCDVVQSNYKECWGLIGQECENCDFYDKTFETVTKKSKKKRAKKTKKSNDSDKKEPTKPLTDEEKSQLQELAAEFNLKVPSNESWSQYKLLFRKYNCLVYKKDRELTYKRLKSKNQLFSRMKKLSDESRVDKETIKNSIYRVFLRTME
eukprot:NODE_562_length_5998_cov_1.109849.p2 type:complete len:256 gc:universal NODE_562_length_5998_cov_1.109849:5818-5051(-)